MKSLLVLSAILLAGLCAAAPVNILFGTLAVTFVPMPAPRNPQLTLKPLAALADNKQQWEIINGFIHSTVPGFTDRVFDITGNSVSEGAAVILYPKNGADNQKWTVEASTGAIKSAKGTNLYLAPNSTKTGLKVSYASPPAVATVKPPVIKPWICQSWGDPHISPYTTGRKDLVRPGSQQPGTYTLSKTGNKNDANYLLIQADQQLCRPGARVYCNKRVILKTQGQLVEINCNSVTVNGLAVTVVGTYNVGSSGVSITKQANGVYLVSYPDGSTKSACRGAGNIDITVTVTGGDQPTGGVCTQYVGGVAPSRKRTVLTPYAFLLSWRAPNRSEDLFEYASDLAWRIANPLEFETNDGNFTTNNETLRNDAEFLCAQLHPSSSLVTQCAGVMDSAAEDYYQACLDDVIATQDYTFAADAINSYAAKCSKYSTGTITLPTSGADSTAAGPGLAAEVPIGAGAVSFDITARNVDGQVVTAGGDVFTTSATGPASVSFSSPNSLGNGVYRVSYTPSVAGAYVISVRHRGVDQVQNSPFSVNFVSNAADPTKTTVAGAGVEEIVPSGTNLGVQVTVYTAAGTRKTTGGDAVTYDVSGALVIKNPVMDNQDGTYDFTYQKNWIEEFQLTIKVNGVNIPGSPFTIECSDDFKK